MVTDIEELEEEMDASELHARRLNAKEVLTPMKGDNFIFPVADGTVKIYGRDQRLRTSALTRDRAEWGDEQEILQGKSDELHSPTPLQDDSTRDDAEAKNDFWSVTRRFHSSPSRGTPSQTVLAERRIISYSDEVHWRHQNDSYILGCFFCWRKIEDYWNVDKDREMSDAWTGSTRFVLLNERPPDGYTWSDGRLTRKQTTSRPDNVWPDMWTHMSDASKRKAKQKCVTEKPKLDNARQLRSIFFIEPDDEFFKHTMKNARGKLEIPMPAAMPCKTSVNCRGETCSSIEKRKTKYACVGDADESTRPRVEGAVHKSHQCHITAKGMNSMTHDCLVHKFIPMPQALKIPDARAAVENNGRNLRKYRHGTWQRSETRKKWSMKQGIRVE